MDELILGRYDDHAGATITQWIAWIDEELTPPLVGVTKEPQVQYVLRAFREALKALQQQEGRDG